MAKKKPEEQAKPEEDEKIKPIYVQPSESTRQIIDKWKEEEGKTISSIIEEAIEMYDAYYSMSPEIFAIFDKYKEKYGNESKIIEEAIKIFDKEHDPKKLNELDLWCRARDEMQMMLIGKTTFNQMIHAAEKDVDSIDMPQRRNIALDVILWYTKKTLKSLSLKEILMAIKKMWVVSNYFYLIEINELEKDTYNLLIKHHQNRKYSDYWLGYFLTLFNHLNDDPDVPFRCAVEGMAFDETVSLTVKELYEKG